MLARLVLTLDALAAITLTLALSSAVFDGFRIRIGSFRFSAESPLRLLGFALILLLVRHALQRRPAFHEHIYQAAKDAIRSESFRAALAPWLLLRVGALAVGFLAIAMIGFGPSALPFRWAEGEVANLQARWDAGWYGGIAMTGYEWSASATGQQNIAFMPALPILIHGVAKLLGYNWVLAGHLIALVMPLLALTYLHRLAGEAGLDRRERDRALLLFAAYPFAVFHGALYTEALFTLAAVAAFLHQLRGQYVRAVLFAAVAGLSRPNGFLLALPLGLLALQACVSRREGRWVPAPARTWLSVPLPAMGAVAGMAAFCVFVWNLTGNPLEWLHSHAAWGRTYSPVINLVRYPWEYMKHSGVVGFIQHDPMHVLNGLGMLLALGAIWPVFRRFGLAYAAFVAINLIPPLFAGGLLSVGRLTSTLFPVFLWLAVALPNRWAWPVTLLFALAQGLAAALFYTWRPFL